MRFIIQSWRDAHGVNPEGSVCPSWSYKKSVHNTPPGIIHIARRFWTRSLQIIGNHTDVYVHHTHTHTHTHKN